MYCGFDFGTSNCSIGFISNNEPILIAIDGESTRLKSLLWASKNKINISQVSDIEVDVLHRSLMVDESKRIINRLFGPNVNLKRLTDVQRRRYDSEYKIISKKIRKQARKSLIRDSMLKAERIYESQGFSSIDIDSIKYGESAFSNHCNDPDGGIFFKSPKTFIGEKLSEDQLISYTKIITRMISHIKEIAEINSNNDFDSVVLGRPVNYSLIRGDVGNKQAIEIMRKAAIDSGFKNIEFEYEPIAAALDFERTLIKESMVLVVDIGGGTTDVTMMRLDPKKNLLIDRGSDIICYEGIRVGGNDIDYAVSLYGMCHFLGRETLNRGGEYVNYRSPVNSNIYSNAMAVNNHYARGQFYKAKNDIDIALKRSLNNVELNNRILRLKVLRDNNLIYLFNRSAEEIKISLSSNDENYLPVSYLGDEFVIHSDSQYLLDCLNKDRKYIKVKELVDRVCISSGVEPDFVYVTGGSASSNLLLDYIFNKKLRNKVVHGDNFSSVSKGLVVASHIRFK